MLVSTKRLFDRETVKNDELGIKSSWLDRALKPNLTLYRMDIAGFQDRAFDGVSFIARNAGNLRQQGFEFDTTITPTRGLSFSGSVAYLDSKFTSFVNASPLPGLPGTEDLTGKPNSFSQEWVGNLAVDLTGDIGSTGMNWAVNGKDDRWSVSVFSRNLANKHYRPLSVYQPLGGPLALINGVFPGTSRRASRVLTGHRSASGSEPGADPPDERVLGVSCPTR